jgi:5'-nucleotidase (lipoprotein e(P4) family)
MRRINQRTLVYACSACMFVGWLLGNLAPTGILADETPAKKVEATVFPMASRVGSNIYLQTSAEYRACCSGIYKSAELRLATVLEKVCAKMANPAIVMDMDETVFDNSAFQTFLYKNNLEYTDPLWDDYEENYPQDVTLIPGAMRFIEKAEAWGVTVVFISNRSEQFKKSTEAALEKNGINTCKLSSRLFLRAKGGTKDKSARRDAVAAKYNVLMYFGDNLRDFSEIFLASGLPNNPAPEDCLAAIRQRAALADDALCYWGVDWFVLPNPVYGEWEKLIGPDPKAIMHPTSMKPKPELTK